VQDSGLVGSTIRSLKQVEHDELQQAEKALLLAKTPIDVLCVLVKCIKHVLRLGVDVALPVVDVAELFVFRMATNCLTFFHSLTFLLSN
jgi:hypothetical protein